MAAIDKVRVLIVGDSGVGKTSLTHLLAHNEPVSSPGWTIGCSVEVKLHEYKEGTSAQKTFFIELWDIGGSANHQNARQVFYQPTHGIILVHDLTNKKSNENLKKWLAEILNKDGKDSVKMNNDMNFDPELLFGTSQVAVMVVGSKLDLLDESSKTKLFQRSVGSIAEQMNADELFLNCNDSNSLTPGTTDAVKFSRFFDKCIEKKFYSREVSQNDRRKYVSPFTSPLAYTSPNLN